MKWFTRFLAIVAIGLCVAGCTTAVESKRQFTAEELKLPGKKGACFTLRDPAKRKGGTWKQNLPKLQKLQAYWNYSWGANLIPEQKSYSDSEFIPMVWGSRGPPEKLEGWATTN